MYMQVILRNVLPKVEVYLKQGCTMSQCWVFEMGPNLFSAILSVIWTKCEEATFWTVITISNLLLAQQWKSRCIAKSSPANTPNVFKLVCNYRGMLCVYGKLTCRHVWLGTCILSIETCFSFCVIFSNISCGSIWSPRLSQVAISRTDINFKEREPRL
jgi:hypothetical protein